MKRQAELALQKTKNIKPPVFDFGGHWKNELGSYMDLKVDAKNIVTGKYVSAVSGSCGPTPSTGRSGNGHGGSHRLHGQLGRSDYHMDGTRCV